MRRIKLILAALAVMVASFVAMSSPAMADDWDNNWNVWNNNCSWNCNNWNNNWWGNNWWNNNFSNCLFLPALTIC